MITRLYDTFQPATYKLTVTIDAKNLRFSGSVDITGTLTEGGAILPLHAKDLTITHAAINDEPVSYQQKPQDVLELQMPTNTTGKTVQASIAFEGSITDDMSGMYPCYFEHEGKKKWLIATQFESHHAREVFPCVDEPAAKATFDVTLITTQGETVLSNMPVKEQSDAGKELAHSENSTTPALVTTFETTPKMSTYLLAFVTGEMHCKEARTKDGVLVRSWSSLAQPADHLDYSLSEAVAIIEFYNDYFETPYPLAKCDQVALPDFDAAAMENWGLITYRETALLADPANRSISSEQYISIVIAHELSHQWFGNLVTMQWWDDLWLNESFASLMEYVAIDALHPDWHIWEDYTTSDAIAASNRDIYSDVQPVRVDVNDPAEISTLFDGAIVYAKGGRLLKMLREYLGEEAFRSGLKSYFKTHAYQNTTRDDLWRSLEAASSEPVSQLMNSWLEQSGMPILGVQQEGTTLSLSQKRLLLDQENTANQVWHIPLLANQEIPIKVLSDFTATIQLASADPILFNQAGSGHFVVDYNSEHAREYLRGRVASTDITTSGRISAFNDLILLARSGNESLVTALALANECQHEPRESVWSLMASVLGHARVLTEGSDMAESKLKLVTGALSEYWYKKLGWEFPADEDTNTTHLRRSILGMMLASEREDVIVAALAEYKKVPPADLPAEIRSLLMSTAVKFGEPTEIDTLLALLKNTQSADLQGDISAALCSTKDPAIGARLTTLLKDKSIVRPQDLIRWYAYLLRNKHTREIMWQWTTENWDWLLDIFKSSKSYDYLPRYAANFMNSTKWLQRYKEFFEPMINDPALTRTIKVGVKEIEARIAWRERDEQKITDWLSSN